MTFALVQDLTLFTLIMALVVVLSAGFVKGAVGFGMPMILVSGLASFLSAEIAIAALILPTVVTNFMQAMRHGLGHAWASFRKYWRYNLVLFVMIVLCAQLVRYLSQTILFTLLGSMIVIFASLQLAGWRPALRQGFERVTEAGIAMIAGFFGGLTGVWGPPTILYLTALEVPKEESVRVQGVMYLMGSVILLSAHLKSGVLNSETIPFSALLVIPAFIGQMIGRNLQDRMNQAVFQRMTLIVLVVAGLNLLRRAAFG